MDEFTDSPPNHTPATAAPADPAPVSGDADMLPGAVTLVIEPNRGPDDGSEQLLDFERASGMPPTFGPVPMPTVTTRPTAIGQVVGR